MKDAMLQVHSDLKRLVLPYMVQFLKFVAKRTYKPVPHPYAIKKLSGDTDMVQMTL